MNKKDLIAPEKYNIAQEIEKYAKDPEKKAIYWVDADGHKTEVTYNQLIKGANKIANIFLEHGIKRGDRILVILPRMIETYEVYLAALKAGIVLIPSSEMLKTKDLQYRITHGEVLGVVSLHEYTDEFTAIKEYDKLVKFTIGAEKDGWLNMDQLRKRASAEFATVDTASDDMAFLSYTSGTTGNPKGVVHTHGWGYAHLKTAPEKWLGIEEDDLAWATAAPGWQKWVWTPLLSVLGSGATGFFYSGRFEPETYLELLQEHQINVLCCTPTEYRMMTKQDNLADYQLPHLRSAVSAGEPLNVEVIEVFKKYFNITVRDGYGQTENTLLLGVTKEMEVRAGSMGKPTPGIDVQIIDEDGNPLGPNQVGDIAIPIDTPALFKEYYKDWERTKKVQRGQYYVTGDQAKKDTDGYFWFEGREDDIIISSGYTIGPFEVEDTLTKHPAIKECAVVSSPDEMRGSIVKAFIVLKDNVDKKESNLVKEIQNFVKQQTAPYKYPREIEFVDQLPKTNSGKIRRVELRAQEWENN